MCPQSIHGENAAPGPHRPLRLRPVTDGDREFLFALYSTTRAQELEAWGWTPTQRDAFLKMQFDAQARSYGAQYPAAEHSIISRDDLPIGRMIVARVDDALRLVDIALMPHYQGLGIGGGLVRQLMQRASIENLPLRLNVLASNAAAIRLYERLGMQRTGGDELYSNMEWKPVR